MRRSRHPGRTPATGATPVPVFANPSGRRWKRLRAVLLTALIVAIATAVVAVPRVLAPPALDGDPIPDGPTVLEVGTPPVVGEGPLVRVLQVLRSAGSLTARTRSTARWWPSSRPRRSRSWGPRSTRCTGTATTRVPTGPSR